MTDYAIVIAIDEYDTPALRLNGGVEAATRLAKWLLERGNIAPGNLLFVSSPKPAGAKWLEGVDQYEANYDGINAAINELIRRSDTSNRVGVGDRLFFSYAGHGLATRVSFTDEDALLAADYAEDKAVDTSFLLHTIFEFFQSTQFLDQFFIIDSCRNLDPEGISFGRMRARRRNSALPSVQQFIIYATSPGKMAVSTQGWMTAACVDGLNGAGRAKLWDIARQSYLVRFDRLFDYVKAEFESRQIKDDVAPQDPQFQIPRRAGEHGFMGRESNPILVEYQPGSFPKVPLEIQLDPNDAITSVVVKANDYESVVSMGPSADARPLHFELPPRLYSVSVESSRFRLAKRRVIELYDKAAEKLELSPSAEAEDGGTGASTGGLGLPGGLARLTVTSDDRLAPLEIVDSSGVVREVGQGGVAKILPPGLYWARLRPQSGPIGEQLIELSEGGDEVVRLIAPSPPADSLLAKLIADREIAASAERDIEILAAPPIHVSFSPESTGSSLVGRLVEVVNGLRREFRERGIGERPDGRGACGLRLLFADEFHSPDQSREFLGGARLRLWPMGTPMPGSIRPDPTFNKYGLAEFVVEGDPGPHWLSVERPGAAPTVFALALLAKRKAELIFHITPGARIHVFQCLPRFQIDEALTFKLFTRLEQLEALIREGRYDTIYATAAPLLQGFLRARIVEPVAGCLGVHLLMKAGRYVGLESTANDLVESYPDLSDAYVLRAAYNDRAGKAESARADFEEALRRGLPILGANLDRLSEGIAKFKIEHDRARVLDSMIQRRVSGLLWSAWAPDKFNEGETLENPGT